MNVTPTCAVVDIGTNSVRLLIARQDATGALVQVERHIRVTRLGQGVDEMGALHPDAIARTCAVLADYQAIWQGFGIPDERVMLMATSAARDASNADEFKVLAIEACGIEPQVITGEKEAEIAFLGATADRPNEPTLVIDIGGGSTEFILADGAGQILGSTSQQMGCVRLTERSGQPPYSPQQVENLRLEARQFVDQAKAVLPAVNAGETTLIGVAGTVTTLAALDLGLSSYQPEQIHGTAVGKDALEDWIARLVQMPAGEIEALGPVEEHRGDVLPAGAIILDEIMAGFGFSVVIASERDSLDGMAATILASTPS